MEMALSELILSSKNQKAQIRTPESRESEQSESFEAFLKPLASLVSLADQGKFKEVAALLLDYLDKGGDSQVAINFLDDFYESKPGTVASILNEVMNIPEGYSKNINSVAFYLDHIINNKEGYDSVREFLTTLSSKKQKDLKGASNPFSQDKLFNEVENISKVLKSIEVDGQDKALNNIISPSSPNYRLINDFFNYTISTQGNASLSEALLSKIVSLLGNDIDDNNKVAKIIATLIDPEDGNGNSQLANIMKLIKTLEQSDKVKLAEGMYQVGMEFSRLHAYGNDLNETDSGFDDAISIVLKSHGEQLNYKLDYGVDTGKTFIWKSESELKDKDGKSLGTFGGGVSHPLEVDIYSPISHDPKAPIPVVISLVGGNESKNHVSIQALGKNFSNAGKAMVSMEYGNKYNGNMDDVRNVLKFVEENAEKYGWDINNITVLGGSRGSQIALRYMMDPDYYWADKNAPEIINGKTNSHKINVTVKNVIGLAINTTLQSDDDLPIEVANDLEILKSDTKEIIKRKRRVASPIEYVGSPHLKDINFGVAHGKDDTTTKATTQFDPFVLAMKGNIQSLSLAKVTHSPWWTPDADFLKEEEKKGFLDVLNAFIDNS